jgi:formate dehydrogenase iron-sulfur subunit
MTTPASTLSLEHRWEGEEPAARRRLPLVSHYLELQRDTTAVERFARAHEARELPEDTRRYRDLVPLERPRPGQQYAFHVDLDACTGCKACVTACHRLNGLDDEEAETWRSVGLLHGGTAAEPVQQTVTTACHHCLDPACLSGCPVGAYEKDTITGIVKHLDDQCIGCQYCTLTCPYEVPQFSKKRGIVRKCDMCSDRLEAGEAPACAQACPNGAITIRVVDVREVLEGAQADGFLPGAPSPGLTLPTTQYHARRAMPANVLPADFYRVREGQEHNALVLMLVLTQLSVGAFAVQFALDQGDWAAFSAMRPVQAPVALLFGLLALGGSTAHLGRPRYVFRALIGLRTSWLSREALLFGLFAPASIAYAALAWQRNLLPRLGLRPMPPAREHAALLALGAVVALMGLAGVGCSVMLYQVTRRAWWSGARTAVKFTMTAAILGLGTTLAIFVTVSALGAELPSRVAIVKTLAEALAAAVTVKLLAELSVLANLRDKQLGELKRTALLLKGPLQGWLWSRVVLGLLGGVVLPLALPGLASSGGACAAAALFAVAVLACGELLERALFFRAVSAPKMPGAVGP